MKIVYNPVHKNKLQQLSTASDFSGDFEPKNSNIQSHITSTSNPHTTTLEQARTVGNTLSGDINFNKFKAVAMACDSGATLPTSPSEGQWFLHTPTGRKVLLQYTNSAWYPLYSFGSMTLYVDGANGTDSADLGFGTGANAWKTLSYMWTQLPSVFYGNIVVNVAAGTYAETVSYKGKAAGGAFTITMVGTESTSDSGTSTSGVQGSGSTYGSITDTTKTWTVDAYKGYFVKIGTNYRVIESNTADTLSIVGYFASSPASVAYSIISPATILEKGASTNNVIQLGAYQSIIFSMVHVRNGGTIEIAVGSGQEGCQVVFEKSWVERGGSSNMVLVGSGSVTFSECYLFTPSNATMIQIRGATAYMIGCYVRSVGVSANRGLYIVMARLLFQNRPSTIDGFATGIDVVSSSGGQSVGSVRNTIKNCTTGIRAAETSSYTLTTQHIYSGNTTDENAVAASFGYID
jgi:hypothetical protein